MSGRLQAKPKTKPAPAPTDEVEGASPASGSANYWQKQYDKAIEKAMASDGDTDMTPIREIRKKAAAAGVTL